MDDGPLAAAIPELKLILNGKVNIPDDKKDADIDSVLPILLDTFTVHWTVALACCGLTCLDALQGDINLDSNVENLNEKEILTLGLNSYLAATRAAAVLDAKAPLKTYAPALQKYSCLGSGPKVLLHRGVRNRVIPNFAT